MTDPIKPATDEDIAVVRPRGYMCIGCDPQTPPDVHGSACIFAMEPKLIARIEADRGTIADLKAENAELRARLNGEPCLNCHGTMVAEGGCSMCGDGR